MSQKIISLEDYEKTIKSMLTQETARILLDSISSHLLSGNGVVFSKMLSVINQHGVRDAKEISQEIINKMSKIMYVDNMEGNNGKCE